MGYFEKQLEHLHQKVAKWNSMREIFYLAGAIFTISRTL